MNPRSNAYDSEDAKYYKLFCQRVFARTAPLRAIDFSRCAFGWLYGFEHTPDTLEYVTSRAAAWDCPCCFFISSLDAIKSNPRWQDCLEVIKIWEDVRAEKKLTEAQRKMLRTLGPECYRDCDACEGYIWRNVPNEPGLSDEARKTLMTPDREHHLFHNEQGEYELVEIHEITNILFGTLKACWFTRQSRPEDTYVLMWAKAGSTDLHLPVAQERLTVMRPFGKKLEIEQDKGGQPVVEVGRRMYLVFSGMKPDEVKESLGRTTSQKTKLVTSFLPASAFAKQSGDFVSAAKAGTSTPDALSDCMVPTTNGTFEAWEKCYIDYKFDVPERGMYRIWARIWCGSSKSDSFFTSIPGDAKSKTVFGNRPIWKKWLWQEGPILQLEEGRATIRFWVRDAVPKQAPFLDVLCLTNCLSYTPNDQDAGKNLKQRKTRK